MKKNYCSAWELRQLANQANENVEELVEEVIEACKQKATVGFYRLTFYKNLSTPALMELYKLGYICRVNRGEHKVEIEWATATKDRGNISN